MDENGLVKLLSTDGHEFRGKDREVRARQTADAQVRIYSELLTSAASMSWAGGNSTRQSALAVREQVVGLLRDAIQVELTQKDTTFVVWSPLPVINETEYTVWRSQNIERAGMSQAEVLRGSAFIVAGIVEEGSLRSSFKDQVLEPLEADIFAAIRRYSFLKNLRAVHEQSEGELLNTVARLQAESDAAGAAIQAEREQFRTLFAERTAELKVASESAEELNVALREVRELFHAQAEESQQRLQNLETSIRAEMELNTMRVLWSDRANEAQRAFWICIAFLVLMSGGALIAMLAWGSDILNFVSPFNLRTVFMNSSVAGSISQQLGRILLVSTPIVVFFWMMKIVVRMLIRSVLLMDDARQRQTIMDSYFLLTKEGKTDDRALPMMLWALFRQVPGHGSDGIEPPDFTEAINAGLKTGILGKSA